MSINDMLRTGSPEFVGVWTMGASVAGPRCSVSLRVRVSCGVEKSVAAAVGSRGLAMLRSAAGLDRASWNSVALPGVSGTAIDEELLRLLSSSGRPSCSDLRAAVLVVGRGAPATVSWSCAIG